ncbi:hypothetical protein [Novosphingobium sp.]|uniref:hypothetical protein n=1 Tax=Novosphingobium sp. TaxID=1874826 RepID=UPI00286C8402|nr:hypothetical protein [Novosphingobium sp.]
MKRNPSLALRGACLLGLGLAVAACGSSYQAPPPGGGGVMVRQEDSFGIAFGTAFRADNNSEPYNVADGDIIAVSLLTEPVDIK